MTNNTYPQAPIFDAVKPLADILVALKAKPPRQGEAKADTYKNLYKNGLAAVTSPDMLTLDEAAARLSVTPHAYRQKVATGDALLIDIEGVQVVPAWLFDKDGKINSLKLDIAREFALEGRDYFKFKSYIDFMTTEAIDISATVPQKKLRAAFASAGLQDYACTIQVNASVNQIIDTIPEGDREKGKNALFNLLLTSLDNKLTRGGWSPMGGLSRPFMDKYKIDGLTIDESYAVPQGKTPSVPPKP